MQDIVNKQVLIDAVNSVKPEDIQAALSSNLKLPPMPDIAPQLISLLSNPYSDANALALVVEKDPHLTVQILKFCQSAFSGFRGNIESIQDAINRVLGYEVTCNLVLGIVIGTKLKLEQKGPLGGKEFWGNALACAELCKMLLNASGVETEEKPSAAYLAGMLHHIGFAILNIIFPEIFSALNQVKKDNPAISLDRIERTCFGKQYDNLNHGQMAALLMENWKLPQHIIIVAKEQHNYDYKGEHKLIVWTLQLAEILLTDFQLSDENDSEIKATLMSRLDISEHDMAQIIQKFSVVIESIEHSVSVLTK